MKAQSIRLADSSARTVIMNRPKIGGTMFGFERLNGDKKPCANTPKQKESRIERWSKEVIPEEGYVVLDSNTWLEQYAATHPDSEALERRRASAPTTVGRRAVVANIWDLPK